MGRSFLLFLLITVANLKMFAQSTSNLVLPTESKGAIEWNVSAFSTNGRANWGYDELAIFVTSAAGESSSVPVQGRFSYNTGQLIFTPYYPFEKGLTYTVRTKNLDTDEYLYCTFMLETKEKYAVAKLLQIYPLANVLPENILRFYLYFNTPMKKGQALKYIRLVDAAGNIDNHAFMEFKQELWSTDGKRLTMVFDPGRIKRGVSTNRELGPALLEGQKYRLTISGAWQNIYGQALSANASKEFIVGQAYRQHIDVESLEIEKPKAYTYDALVIHFDRLMDHALIHSMLQIENEEGNPIAGHWEISDDETKALFFPEDTWKKGNYRILMHGNLEDLAGNNLNALLDEKIGHKSNNSIHQLIRLIAI